MPYLFLSPSTQAFNPYITTGNEKYWMNLLADAMEPHLRASGINVTRNNPDGSAVTSIRQSNSGNYDFHLALHSNAAPDARSGQLRGSIAFYYPGSLDGLRMADIIVDNLKQIYPLPDRVRATPSTSIGELRQTNAPAVLVEIAYHDNAEDARWIQENIDAIAQNLALSVAEYFGLQLLTPQAERQGTVSVASGGLNQRALPAIDAPILQVMPNGATVTILNETGNWYVVEYNGTIGFASRQYIR